MGPSILPRLLAGTVTFPLRTDLFLPDDLLITTTVEIEDLAGATEVITGNNTASAVSPIDLITPWFLNKPASRFKKGKPSPTA